MTTEEIIKQTALYQTKLELIDKRLAFLSTMGMVIAEESIEFTDLVIVTRPRNGAQPITIPLYPAPRINPNMMGFLQDEGMIDPVPNKQVGFQRYYQYRELGDEEILHLDITLEAGLTLALIDFLSIRLKQQRQAVLVDMDNLLKNRG